MLQTRNLRRIIHKAMTDPGYALHSGRRRLSSYLAYLGDTGRVRPETVSILVGYRCNLSCAMCGQWGERGSFREKGERERRREITLDTVRRIVGQVSAWKPAVTLFGGEPLLASGIIPMIRCITEAGLRCNMITNGTLLGEVAGELVGVGLDEVIVSLDGPEEVHDRMRGRDRAFETATGGIRLLEEEKRAAGSRKPVVNINATIWEENAARLSELVPIARGLGAATLTFHHPIFIGREDMEKHREVVGSLYGVSRSDFDGFVREHPPRIDVDLLLGEKQQAEAASDGVKVSFYPNYTDEEVRDYYRDVGFRTRTYSGRCRSPWMSVYIFPNGDVRPCLSLGVSYGNIEDAPFEEILDGEEARRFRQDLKRRGMFPACARCTELCRF